MKLGKAAAIVCEGYNETLTYYGYASEHHRSIRTNNPLERIMREIWRRTRVVGAFPDGKAALMLVSARLRHITASEWRVKRYMNTERLWRLEKEGGQKTA